MLFAIAAGDGYFIFILVMVGEITTVAILINSDIIRIDDISMTVVFTMNFIIKFSAFSVVHCAIHTVGAMSHENIRCWGVSSHSCGGQCEKHREREDAGEQTTNLTYE